MTSNDPKEGDDIGSKLHMGYREWPNIKNIFEIISMLPTILYEYLFFNCLIMVGSQNWPDLMSQISKFRDMRFVSTDALIN